jgi:hypothetical protein
MERTMVLREKVDYCPVVHGGCGEPLEWIPRRPSTEVGSRPDTIDEMAADGSEFLEATCGSCGHVWSLPPGVGLER